MAEEGPVCVFVNPAGFFHDIVTVTEVTGLLLSGPPVTRDSWFAGYSWTIAQCSACGLHLGWRFDALEGQSPPVFWGLRRAALSEG
ncbi:MAG: cereblon family protein, partial [Myxococcota bacterium]|nr:cereblon family protein [Myxococcota bacterium]